ncbi:hypothetical protein P280DRAFT_524299 [Massarina eburnea CBS 473.64]|uniref:Uncharacterized protein n=1 Tax=Massarina eburnea CBS 473.64 TaxID=1395130 RepID=A0A6A6RG98_9PLEO|nr:hypothetical protein P280DRAFT_524299 [Massarina eburnea CBS 473.64]
MSMIWRSRSTASTRRLERVVSSDHNQYVNGIYAYQANYKYGLSVLDISAVAEEDVKDKIQEVAYFDWYPEDNDQDLTPEDTQNSTELGSRAGRVYTSFGSGIVVLKCIERGMFALRVSSRGEI